MVVLWSSIMCIAWKTVFESLRPQFQLLTLARFSHFTHATSTVARRTCTLPKLISVNLHEIAVASDKHSNGRNHSNHSSTYGQIGSCSWGSVHKFLARSRLIVRRLHSTSFVQDWKDPYCRRFLNTDTQNSDINRQSSIIALFPKQIQPYLFLARIDRPIGYWLLFLPGAWSISLAAEASSLPDLKLLTLFFVGSLLMRSAGCVINDLWDSDFDKMVARTSSRPVAAGIITPFQALVFLGSQLSLSLGILLSLNLYSIVLGASSLILVITYPLMKRITFWPQLFLGLAMNWGCLLGWTAVNGSLDWSVCLPLYIAAVNWTIFYDTIYAFQDVEDDRRVGVKSTALLFGNKAKPYLAAFSAIIIANLLAVGINTSQTWPYYLGLGGVTSHLVWQVSQVDLSEPKDCLSKFKSNKWLGVLVLMSIVMSTLLKRKDEKVDDTG